MVSGRQSEPAYKGPAQTNGDLDQPRKENKGTKPRTNPGRGREIVRKGKGSREKHSQTEMSETETDRHRKHERQRQNRDGRERQRKSEIKKKDPGWKRGKDRKSLRKLSTQRLMEVEKRAETMMPTWTGGGEGATFRG